MRRRASEFDDEDERRQHVNQLNNERSRKFRANAKEKEKADPSLVEKRRERDRLRKQINRDKRRQAKLQARSRKNDILDDTPGPSGSARPGPSTPRYNPDDENNEEPGQDDRVEYIPMVASPPVQHPSFVESVAQTEPHHFLVDATIQTATPISTPLRLETNTTTAPPSPLTPLPVHLTSLPDVASRPYNLVDGVKGVQVSSQSETVEWRSGQVTIVPSLYDGGKDVLTRDARWIKELADFPEGDDKSSNIVYISRDKHNGEIISEARDALRAGKVVVLRQFYDVGNIEFTEDGLYDAFNMMPGMPVTTHDLLERSRDYSQPYVNTTLGDFMQGIDNPDQMRFILDFPMSQLSMPSPLDLLDDGLTIGWNQTSRDYPLGGEKMTGENWAVRSWGLAHHAGILTYPHHDAEGANTYIIPLVGVKNWCIISINKDVPQKKLGELVSKLCDPDASLLEFKQYITVEVIHAYPGDLVIQPGGQVHGVYTPIASLVRGGHFFSYDTMHLTELSRWTDVRHGQLITNQTHVSTLQTLCRMVLALPLISSRRKFYKKSLVALCTMVTSSSKYVLKEVGKLKSDHEKEAVAIGRKVLDFFGLTGRDKAFLYLREDTGDWANAGEEVDLSSIFLS